MLENYFNGKVFLQIKYIFHYESDVVDRKGKLFL